MPESRWIVAAGGKEKTRQRNPASEEDHLPGCQRHHRLAYAVYPLHRVLSATRGAQALVTRPTWWKPRTPVTFCCRSSVIINFCTFSVYPATSRRANTRFKSICLANSLSQSPWTVACAMVIPSFTPCCTNQLYRRIIISDVPTSFSFICCNVICVIPLQRYFSINTDFHSFFSATCSAFLIFTNVF